MRLINCKLLLLAIAVVPHCSAAFAASEGAIKGRVLDSEGASIKGAHLLFHPDLSGRLDPAPASDIVRETDAFGGYDVQVEPGFYDVCVMAKAFTPECRKIFVTKGEKVQHNVRLNADPLVVKHLGDTFE